MLNLFEENALAGLRVLRGAWGRLWGGRKRRKLEGGEVGKYQLVSVVAIHLDCWMRRKSEKGSGEVVLEAKGMLSTVFVVRDAMVLVGEIRSRLDGTD